MKGAGMAGGSKSGASISSRAWFTSGGKRVCQEAGMDGFLTKPVDPAELEEMFLMLFPSEERSHIVAA